MKTLSTALILLISLVVKPTTTAYVIVPGRSKQSVAFLGSTAKTALQLSTTESSSSPLTKQASYGETEELPDSYVRCSKCEAAYAIREEDLGDGGGGRRLECSVCGHSWFQSKGRIMTLENDFILAPLPERDLIRIQRNMQEGKNPKFLGDKKIYVGNISFECHEDDLYQIFSACGDVGDVSLVRDENGRNRGFGFVTMRSEDDALKAVAELDGMSIRGRNIAVRESTS